MIEAIRKAVAAWLLNLRGVETVPPLPSRRWTEAPLKPTHRPHAQCWDATIKALDDWADVDNQIAIQTREEIRHRALMRALEKVTEGTR